MSCASARPASRRLRKGNAGRRSYGKPQGPAQFRYFRCASAGTRRDSRALPTIPSPSASRLNVIPSSRRQGNDDRRPWPALPVFLFGKSDAGVPATRPRAVLAAPSCFLFGVAQARGRRIHGCSRFESIVFPRPDSVVPVPAVWSGLEIPLPVAAGPCEQSGRSPETHLGAARLPRTQRIVSGRCRGGHTFFVGTFAGK